MRPRGWLASIGIGAPNQASFSASVTPASSACASATARVSCHMIAGSRARAFSSRNTCVLTWLVRPIAAIRPASPSAASPAMPASISPVQSQGFCSARFGPGRSVGSVLAKRQCRTPSNPITAILTAVVPTATLKIRSPDVDSHPWFLQKLPWRRGPVRFSGHRHRTGGWSGHTALESIAHLIG